MSDYRLHVTFNDGLTGVIDMRKKIYDPKAGIFAVLRNPDIFNAVGLEYGAVSWPCGLDLAPDAMYDVVNRHALKMDNSIPVYEV
jgi:hypothetical protein